MNFSSDKDWLKPLDDSKAVFQFSCLQNISNQMAPLALSTSIRRMISDPVGSESISSNF